MSLTVHTNLSALLTRKQLARNDEQLQTAIARLSSGKRINSAQDDAAGIGIATRMTAQLGRLSVAIRNASDGISFAQVTEGALAEAQNLLQRARELTLQAANGSMGPSDRASLASEIRQIMFEIDRLATQTDFNGHKMLADPAGFEASFQIGAQADQLLSTTVRPMRGGDLGVATNLMAIGATTDGQLAARLRTQSASGFAGATLNGAPLADVPAGSAASAKVAALRTSNANVAAQLYGNALVGTAPTANAAGPTADGDVIINGVAILGTPNGTVAETVAAINARSADHGVRADAGAGGTLVLFNRTGDPITLQVRAGAAAAASATGFAAGSSSVQGAGSNGAIVLSYDLGTASLATDGAGTAAALGEAGGGAAVALTDRSLATLDLSTQDAASAAVLALTRSLDTVNTVRGELGVFQSRLDAAISASRTSFETTSAARARIEDADFAAESAALSRAKVLNEAGVSILAQANALPQNALQLLRR